LKNDNTPLSIGEDHVLKFQGVQILWGCKYGYLIEKPTESDFVAQP
jgi:hypothetical protein